MADLTPRRSFVVALLSFVLPGAISCSSSSVVLDAGDAGADIALDGPASPEDGDNSGSDGSEALDVALDAPPRAPDEAVCRAAVTAICRRYATCLGTPIDACLKTAEVCPDYYFSEGSNRTVAGVQACLPGLDSRPCTDVGLSIVEPCLVGGARAPGAACAFPSQCQTNACSNFNMNGCGVCTGTAVAKVSDSCRFDRCEPGTFCHPTKVVCRSIDGIVHAGRGQPCDLSADPVIGCTGDLLCIPAVTGSNAGTCQPLPSADEPCAKNVTGVPICAEGLECRAGICQLMGRCGDTTCAAGQFCARGDAGTACAPRAAEGEPCRLEQTIVDPRPPCLPGLTCAPAPDAGTDQRICTRFRERGDACDGDHACLSVLACVDGRCASPAGAACGTGSPDAAVD